MRAPISPSEQAFRDAEFDAHPMWRRGEVVPARLTMLLDARGLYGPDVDRACGVREPAVDEWEAGTRYPEFQQLVALARLVHADPTFFFGAMPPQPTQIFICGRPRSKAGLYVPEAYVTSYPDHVWRPVVEAWGTLW